LVDMFSRTAFFLSTQSEVRRDPSSTYCCGWFRTTSGCRQLRKSATKCTRLCGTSATRPAAAEAVPQSRDESACCNSAVGVSFRTEKRDAVVLRVSESIALVLSFKDSLYWGRVARNRATRWSLHLQPGGMLRCGWGAERASSVEGYGLQQGFWVSKGSGFPGFCKGIGYGLPRAPMQPECEERVC